MAFVVGSVNTGVVVSGGVRLAPLPALRNSSCEGGHKPYRGKDVGDPSRVAGTSAAQEGAWLFSLVVVEWGWVVCSGEGKVTMDIRLGMLVPRLGILVGSTGCLMVVAAPGMMLAAPLGFLVLLAYRSLLKSFSAGGLSRMFSAA